MKTATNIGLNLQHIETIKAVADAVICAGLQNASMPSLAWRTLGEWRVGHTSLRMGPASQRRRWAQAVCSRETGRCCVTHRKRKDSRNEICVKSNRRPISENARFLRLGTFHIPDTRMTGAPGTAAVPGSLIYRRLQVGVSVSSDARHVRSDWRWQQSREGCRDVRFWGSDFREAGQW